VWRLRAEQKIHRDQRGREGGREGGTERKVAADEQVEIIEPCVGALFQEPFHDVDLPQRLKDGEVVDVVGDELTEIKVKLPLKCEALVVLMVDLHPCGPKMQSASHGIREQREQGEAEKKAPRYSVLPKLALLSLPTAMKSRLLRSATNTDENATMAASEQRGNQ